MNEPKYITPKEVKDKYEVSYTPPSGDGKLKESLEHGRLPEETAATTPRMLGGYLENRKERLGQPNLTIVTPVSHPITSGPILTGKLNTSNPKPNPVPSSSKTSAPESTGIAPVSRGFWDSHMTERSRQLPLPTGIDCVDLPMSSWNGSLKRLGSKSWFSVKVKTITQIPKRSLPKTSSLSPTTLLPKTMASGQPKTEKEGERKKEEEKVKGKPRIKEREMNQRLLREQRVTEARNKEVQKAQTKKRKRREKQAEKRRETKGKAKVNDYNSAEEYSSMEKEPSASNITIKLFPTEKQKNTLNQWIGTTRWTYNQTLSLPSRMEPR